MPINIRAKIVITLPITTTNGSAYAAGDNIGGKLTLPYAVRLTGGKGTISTVVLADLDKQNAEFDVVFFKADPSGSTLTNDAAISITDADILNAIGSITISPAHYIDLGASALATQEDLCLDFESNAQDIYASLVSRGTPTYTGTSNLQLSVTIERD